MYVLVTRFFDSAFYRSTVKMSWEQRRRLGQASLSRCRSVVALFVFLV